MRLIIKKISANATESNFDRNGLGVHQLPANESNNATAADSICSGIEKSLRVFEG